MQSDKQITSQTQSQIMNFPRIREDLELVESPDGTMQVRDPVNCQFFCLGQRETKIVKSLSQLHSKEELLHLTEYDEEHIDQFFKLLYRYKLLQQSAEQIKNNGKTNSIKPKNVLSFLFQRLNCWNPDNFLSELSPKLQWLWSLPVKIIVGLVLIKGLLVSVEYAENIRLYGWPALGGSWILSFLVFSSILSVVLLGHEIMHGLMLKRFGGNVKEMGFCLVYFSPSFYTDVSDIYKLKSKSQKVWIMLIGPIFQALIGCIAITLWAESIPHEMYSDLLYLTVIASFLTLGLNLNPLLKMDGYRAIEFGFQVPNLRSRAWSYVASLFTGKNNSETLTSKERLIFLLYAPLSVIYSCFIVSLLMSFYVNMTILSVPALSMVIISLFVIASLSHKD